MFGEPNALLTQEFKFAEDRAQTTSTKGKKLPEGKRGPLNGVGLGASRFE
jgi:hypothetical protein